jgi:hypothetical protein
LINGAESSALCGADNEGASSGFDDVFGDHGQVIDTQDAFDLDEQPVQEAEVSAGKAASARSLGFMTVAPPPPSHSMNGCP